MACRRRRASLACMLHAPPHVRPHTTTGGALAPNVVSQHRRSNVRRASEPRLVGISAPPEHSQRQQSEQAAWSSGFAFAN